MNAFGCGLLVLIIGLPVAWLASEFGPRRWVSIVLGLLSLVVVTGSVSTLWTALSHFQYNSDFGVATSELINASIAQLEDGHSDRVLKGWRGLAANYQPTYENRGHYPELAAEAAAMIRGDTEIVPGSKWDVPNFGVRTWAGHWETDDGYWLVISDSGEPAVWRSGDPPERMRQVRLSPDFKTMTFPEGDRWRHTLTLDGKYRLSHEWFDWKDNKVWRTGPMFKLVRAADGRR